jgi:hypothetical protein
MYLLPLEQSCSAANIATRASATKINLIDILEFIQVKNHMVAHCVANCLQGVTSWHTTKETLMLKKLA